MVICKECGKEKTFCKLLCSSCYSKQYRLNNLEKIKNQEKIIYLKNRDKELKRMKKWREDNREYFKIYNKEWNKNNKDKIKEQDKRWHQKYKSINNKKRLQREHNNNNFKMRTYLSTRIRIAIKAQYGEKAYNSIKLIGCSIKECILYIEKQFKEGMTWNNHGKWHIDHIIPCASFDLTKEEEQLKCFHYSNLQPLWAEENFNKGAKV